MRRSKIVIEPVRHPDLTVHAASGQVLIRQLDSEDVAVCWPDIDAALPISRAGYVWSPAAPPLTDHVRGMHQEILRQRVSSRSVFNGKVVRQNTDLTPTLVQQNGTVTLSRTDYFSLLCSNYLTTWRIRDAQTDAVLLTGDDLIRDSTGALSLLDDNGLANVVGVSTAAFTADGKLALVWQHPKAESSSGLIAPAGSGSMDVEDVSRVPWRRETLTSVLIRAMERELAEECNVSLDDIEWTEVTGYHRWLNKGAKPEYTGVSRLRLTSHQLRGRQPRVTETAFVQRVMFDHGLDLTRLAANPESLDCLDGRVRDQVSMPLYMTLRALGHGLARPDAVGARLRQLDGGTPARVADPRIADR